MPHIAIVAESLGAGGTERVISTLAGGLTINGHKVDLIIFTPECACPQDIPENVRIIALCGRKKWTEYLPSIPVNEITVEWINTKKSFFVLLKIRAFLLGNLLKTPLQIPSCRGFDRGTDLYQYLQQENPDILVVNQRLPEYAAYYSKKISRKGAFPPVVSIYHSVEGSEGKLERSNQFAKFPYLESVAKQISTRARRRKVLVSISDHIIAVSNGVKDSLADTCDLSRENLSVIYNPMDICAIRRRSREMPKHAWFNDNGPPIILGVGRFTHQKDFRTLIDAFQLLLNHRSYRLVVLGDGPLRIELENRVKLLNLEPYVSFPGWVANPWSYMSRSALFVLSSRYDALPTVLIEALICSCKAVATNCPGGAVEILEDPKLLAPLDSTKALAKVMLGELERPAEQSEFEKKICKFSTKHIVSQYEKIIYELTRTS